MFRRDSRLLLRSMKYILIIGCVLLFGCAGVIYLIMNQEAGGSKPMTMVLLNEDKQNSFSDLVLSIVASNDNIETVVEIEFVETEEEAIAAVQNGAAAAMIIPEDFFASLNYGENYPCRIVLNNANLSSAQTLRYFAGIGSDMLSAAQYAIYEGDLYMVSRNADDQSRTDYNLYLNTAMISEAASAPEKYFEITNLGYTKIGLPMIAHYVALYLGFFFSLLSICLFHLYRDDFSKDPLIRLSSAGVSRFGFMKWKIILPGIIFALITVLALVFGRSFFALHLSASAVILAAAAVVFASVMLGLYATALGDASGAIVFIIFFVSLFFCGGIIPYSNLSLLALKIGSFTPLGVIYSLFSPIFGAAFEPFCLIPMAIYLGLGIWMFYNAWHQTILGKETV